MAKKYKVDPEVQRVIDEYNRAYDDLCKSGELLYRARLNAAGVIAKVEDLVNSVANHPKTFDIDIGTIRSKATPHEKMSHQRLNMI